MRRSIKMLRHLNDVVIVSNDIQSKDLNEINEEFVLEYKRNLLFMKLELSL